jgi:multidrug efflux pump subunit AcrA (membrane-fusion protein)
MRELIRIIGILAVLMVIYGFAYYIEIPYSISTRGIIMPQREWRLSRLPDGTIMNSEKDNRNNNVSFFSVLEFHRGDHARFIVNETIFSGTGVKKGDTIGRIISFEEEQRLLQLQTRLAEQKGLLAVALSGEKQEKINAANEKINLALQEYDTQKRLMARMESLHDNGVIADEEWDLARNNYLVTKQNINITRAEFEMLQAGAKSEEIDLIRTSIISLEKLIYQAERRLEAFNIQAPFSGTIIREQAGGQDSETIIRIADMEKMVITLPVEIHQIPYIENGSRVSLRAGSRHKAYEAEIINIDNTIHYIDRRQNIFVTAIVENNPGSLMPNMLVQAEISSEPVSAWDYLRRIFVGVFEN